MTQIQITAGITDDRSPRKSVATTPGASWVTPTRGCSLDVWVEEIGSGLDGGTSLLRKLFGHEMRPWR